MRAIFKNSVFLSVASAALLLSACEKEEKTTTPPPSETENSTNYLVPKSSLTKFMDCIREDNATLISAHRGGYPENTLFGMERALEKLPAIMEIDVATSNDGVLFLMHDDTLERTTNLTGEVSNFSWTEIKNASGDVVLRQILKAGDKYTVPEGEEGAGLVMSTGNAGGITVFVGGKKLGKLGEPAKVKRNLSLDAKSLKKLF